MDRYLVISSDCHAGLPPAKYRDYLDPQYRETFDVALPIQLEQVEKMSAQFLVKEINEKWREGHDAALSGAWDHDERIKVLDGDGVAGEVIFPDGITEMNMPPFGAGLSLPTEGGIVPELQWAGARSHNRWLAELVSQAPDRHVGVALVPALWDVDEAVREVEWAAKNGLSGALLPCQWGKHAPYHHPKYDKLWAACQDNDVVVHFHSGPAPMDDYFGDMADPDRVKMPGAMGIYVSEVCWFAVRPLTFLMWGGVFERFPKIKVVITEGTVVWVPEYLELMDHRYTDTHQSAKLGDYHSHLKMKPSEYFARNVGLGASCLSSREAEMRNQIGVRNIMWGSDYPHPEGTWPFTKDHRCESLRGLPEADIAAILGENAARFFGFDTERLAPIVERIGPKKGDFAEVAAA